MRVPAKGTSLKGHALAGYEMEKRDVSAVSIIALRNLLNGAGDIDRQRLSEASEVYIRSIHRVYRPGEQTVMGITMADRILMAVSEMGYGSFRLGVDIPVLPAQSAKDALVMAVQENLDDEDVLQADQATIEARIAELMALRDEAEILAQREKAEVEAKKAGA